MKKEYNNLQDMVYDVADDKLPLHKIYNGIKYSNNPMYEQSEAYEDLKILTETIIELKEQLIEKDKEIDRLKHPITPYKARIRPF